MENDKISRWVAVAGFAVLAVGLGLEIFALYATYANRSELHSSIERPEPIIRFLVDRSE